MKICFMGWLYEFIGVVVTFVTPYLRNYGLYYLYFPDVILMFLVIPFVHLMNDEDTKTVITEEGWIQGLKHMLGIHCEQDREDKKDTH